MNRRWIEETEDPTTGEKLIFEADTEEELDAKITDRLGAPEESADEDPIMDDGRKRS